jgi:hypothetical protein
VKPEYEKPAAVALGEALKGSGECNVGSAVLVGEIDWCQTGTVGRFKGVPTCEAGTSVNNLGIKVA